MKVYCISGLGADRRMFQKLRLPAPHEMVYLDWIPPVDGESLSQYARRLAASIDTSSEFSVLGLSMGGMIASEISCFLNPAHCILISSVPAPCFLPPYFRWAGKWHLQRAVPMRFFKSASLVKRFFTAETPEEKKMLREVIREADADFVRWSINAILSWNFDGPCRPVIHIHGSRDELLPIRYLKPTYRIKGGGHMMIISRAQVINELLATVFG